MEAGAGEAVPGTPLGWSSVGGWGKAGKKGKERHSASHREGRLPRAEEGEKEGACGLGKVELIPEGKARPRG